MSVTIFEALPQGYAFVLLLAALIAFHCFITGFRVAPLRAKYFTKEFFEKHFPELKGNLGRVDHGYPDMGSGIFSHKLTMDQYLTFNNAQRAHYNYIEGLPLILVILLISGLSYTRLTVLLGALYIVGREIYTTGYISSKGPSGRLAGALIIDVVLIVLFGAAVYSTFTAAGGISGLSSLFGIKA